VLLHSAEAMITQNRLKKVSSDWKELCCAMEKMAVDWCGVYLPSDTSWRSPENPTFETQLMFHPAAPQRPDGIRATHCLTTPIAYIERFSG